MKVIDAHLHMRRHAGFERLCAQSGHELSFSHLMQSFRNNDVAACIVMGSLAAGDDMSKPGLFDLGGPVNLDDYNYPDHVAFCIGVSPKGLMPDRLKSTLAAYERALSSPHCVGIKIYLGYFPYYASDPLYKPIYELALAHDLPVVFHTGDTANPAGRLKYSHPLTVDDIAVDYPQLKIVLAHFGNPWLVDAAEVAKKNHNVYIDLSGLAVGKIDVNAFRSRYAGYVSQLETWLAYLDRYDRVLYGTDWPLVNLRSYQALIRSIVPQDAWENVFFNNACEVFSRLKPIL